MISFDRLLCRARRQEVRRQDNGQPFQRGREPDIETGRSSDCDARNSSQNTLFDLQVVLEPYVVKGICGAKGRDIDDDRAQKD